MKNFILSASLILAPLSANAASVFFDFAGGSATPAITGTAITSTDYDPRSATAGVGVDDSAVSSFSETAFFRAENTGNTSNPVGNNNYHTFTITVDPALPAGQSVNLTAFNFDYFATNISGLFFTGVYSDRVGYTGTGDKLDTTNISTNAGQTFNIDLSSSNIVAGTAFTGLTAGDTAEFRIFFGDGSTSNDSIHRIDNLSVDAVVIPEPSAAAILGLLGIFGFSLRRRR